ncbi:outer membrane autotransporter barrel domain protein, partial [Escherichia coli 97.0010]
LSRG